MPGPQLSGMGRRSNPWERAVYCLALSARFARSAIEMPSAAAIPSTVVHEGLPSPLSIKESMFLVIPASAARVSRLSSFLVRSSRMARPRACCDWGF